MLITFKTSAYANITMFGDVGLKLLEMMNFGKAVPGAITAEDVPQALINLQQGLATIPQQPEAAGAEDDDQPSTSLHTRAVPLLELLKAATVDHNLVRWE
jgi:hypothetical protein